MRKQIASFITNNQILTALFVLAIAWLIVQTKDVLIALFFSYILMASISPYSEFLERKGLPRAIAIILPYLATIFFLFVLILSLLPFMISQVQVLFSKFPSYINQDIQLFNYKIDNDQLNSVFTSELENIGRGAFSLTSRVFGGIISLVTVFAISFYLLLYRDTVRKSFVNIFPKSSQLKVERTTIQVEDKLGSWLRGQVVLSAAIGVLTWVSLSALGIEFALPLAVIAAFLEIVPTIGPILAAIPAIIVALNVSLPTTLIVSLIYFLIQLVENHVLVPRVMQKAVGLNPIVIILGIIIGGRLLGIPGALLAIPFISLLVVIYKNLE